MSETLRADGKIGSSLQAEVTLHVPTVFAELLASLGDDLRLVLITSQAKIVLAEGYPESQQDLIASDHMEADGSDRAGDPSQTSLRRVHCR